MSNNDTQYLLVSLPNYISPSNTTEGALTTLRSTVTTDNGTVVPFHVPHFGVRGIDSVYQHAEELDKLRNTCEGVVAQIGDKLKIILEGDEEKIKQQKNVNDKPVDQYLRTFQWNKVKYREDKPMAELIDSLQKEVLGLDNDVKNKYNQYNTVKTTLTNLQRKQIGNLATKSLTTVVDKEFLTTGFENLQTQLVAVPKNAKNDFIDTYATLCTLPEDENVLGVVPKSAKEVREDDEFILYAVIVWKRVSTEFVQKCREHKWVPRDFEYSEGGKEEEKKELERTQQQERKVWGEVLRLARTAWSEAVMIWIHVLCLRVWAETALRYGLPLEFVSALVKTTPKLGKKAKQALDSTFSYLGGKATARDKKGRVVKDDSALSSEISAAGGGGDDYTPYVYYEFQIV